MWMYRNRLGEPTIPAGHSLHYYAAQLPGWRGEKSVSILESRSKYPDYYSIVKGKTGGFINLANPNIPSFFAEGAITRFKEGKRKGSAGGKIGIDAISMSPDDGYLMDERPEVQKMNDGMCDPNLENDIVFGCVVWFFE